LKKEKLAHAEKVEEISSSHTASYVRFHNVENAGAAVSILCCGVWLHFCFFFFIG
jgi:hypothetical protein